MIIIFVFVSNILRSVAPVDLIVILNFSLRQHELIHQVVLLYRKYVIQYISVELLDTFVLPRLLQRFLLWVLLIRVLEQYPIHPIKFV